MPQCLGALNLVLCAILCGQLSPPLYTMRCYLFPNYRQTKDERATDNCFVPLLGRIRVAECIQLIVDAGLLAACIISYPPHVKDLGLAKGSWRLSVNMCCVLCRCGALVSMVCIY